MSAMYQEEVPLYGDLLRVVRNVNLPLLNEGGKEITKTTGADMLGTTLERLNLERHGAIRLGTPYELRTVKRIFGVMGMYPVGYYNLSPAGLPMHATCFRPTTSASLRRNPFRIFATLLRAELLNSEKAQPLSRDLLGKRSIFTDELLELLEIAESQGGRLREGQAGEFIPQALRTFSWLPVAASTFDQYNGLKAEHLILADIACFRSAHINHLTPRTLDISTIQKAMEDAKMAVKPRIEGPPLHKCPILLQQTSFLALEENIEFRKDDRSDCLTSPTHDSSLIRANHKARFGEIEERGAAVTAKGRELYDKLLHESLARAVGLSTEEQDDLIHNIFTRYPDDWAELRRQGLIYCEYHCTKKLDNSSSKATGSISLLEQLIMDGIVEATPITYEGFLPFSAAGIFQSNLQANETVRKELDIKAPKSDYEGFREALAEEPLDAETLYANIQQASLRAVAQVLGLSENEFT
ncbi:hypothetical protein F5883DRAFT_653283 [Diaporthe sp. PMI_573]|nr:hypothetical protein F5883DRAFT_653283 [Diaporthaceae sp. PMI_573]